MNVLILLFLYSWLSIYNWTLYVKKRICLALVPPMFSSNQLAMFCLSNSLLLAASTTMGWFHSPSLLFARPPAVKYSQKHWLLLPEPASWEGNSWIPLLLPLILDIFCHKFLVFLLLATFSWATNRHILYALVANPSYLFHFIDWQSLTTMKNFSYRIKPIPIS